MDILYLRETYIHFKMFMMSVYTLLIVYHFQADAAKERLVFLEAHLQVCTHHGGAILAMSSLCNQLQWQQQYWFVGHSPTVCREAFPHGL